jgi:hypothetical protein
MLRTFEQWSPQLERDIIRLQHSAAWCYARARELMELTDD